MTPTIVRTSAAFRGSPLARAYVRGDEGALAFYPDHYARPGAYREKLEEVRGRFTREGLERAAGLVRPGPGSPAGGPSGTERPAERLEAMVREGGGFVVTGQQPALFGGPLYTVYKAVTAVALARALEERLEVPVVPLFWIASEDHDWTEVSETHLLDPENELRTVSLDPPGDGSDGGPAPPFHRPAAGPSVERALEEFLEALPETDFSATFTELVTSAYGPERSLDRSFAALLQGLPGLGDLCTVDAADPGLKEATLPLLLEELDGSAESEALLRERSGELEAAGWPVQASVLPGGVNLFLEGAQGRERLFRDEEAGGFRLRHSGERLTRQEVVRRVEEDPRVLSPNVFLRPVAESSALPVLASVTGPGEIAYFAQLGPLFQRHGMAVPVVHPRFSAFLVERKVSKVLERFSLEVDDLAGPRHEVEARVARDELPEGVTAALERIRRELGEGTAELESAALEVDPTLQGAVDRARRHAFHAVEEAERKILQGLKRKNEVALKQLAKAQRHLFPQGRPQERSISPFYFLVRYGAELMERLREEADGDCLRKPEPPAG